MPERIEPLYDRDPQTDGERCCHRSQHSDFRRGNDQLARAWAPSAASERAWKIVAFNVSGSNGFVTR